MADPDTAAASQLRHIEEKTGKSLQQLCELIASSGLTKVAEQRKMLMDQLGLGYGDANTLALSAKAAANPPASGADPIDAIYSGNKASLRPLHDRLMSEIAKLGEFERAPKKSYLSMRRKKQFAMLGPATKDAVELGLNVRDLPTAPRLKVIPPGGMCQYAVRISTPAEIDAELLGWIRSAYEAAG